MVCLVFSVLHHSLALFCTAIHGLQYKVYKGFTKLAIYKNHYYSHERNVRFQHRKNQLNYLVFGKFFN